MLLDFVQLTVEAACAVHVLAAALWEEAEVRI